MGPSPRDVIEARTLGFDPVAWRGVAGYRVASLGYALLMAVRNLDVYDSRTAAYVVLGLMVAWTAVAVTAYLLRPGWIFLVADLAVTAALLLATVLVETDARIEGGAPSIATIWAAGPVLAWAAHRGLWSGLTAAAVISAASIGVRGELDHPTVQNVVLLFLAGTVVGYVSGLARRAEAVVARAVTLEAATAERERLARRIHDGVLQVLALVERRGDPELARLAAEQEVALRALVSSPPADLPAGQLDLRTLLLPYAKPGITVSTPSEPVRLPAHCAQELAAATRAALDNVAKHVGAEAPAWVLVEDEGDAVLVTIRDEGPGVSSERLAEAEAAGRLGVAQSIRGRIADLGGTMTLESTLGQGTEVELRVSR